MTAVTFKGGVHPPDGKEKTKGLAIESITPPEEIVLPLSQHIGAPAKPCVAVGDEVMVGQVIANAGGFVSARIHASVSGKVKCIENRPGSNGLEVPSIVIENDGEDRTVELVGAGGDWSNSDIDVLKKYVQDAGLVGMGGATFPTHVKLSPPSDKKIDAIILNGAECEPMLTADHRLMLESPDSIIDGLKIAMKILGAKQGIIGIEKNKPDAIDVMSKAASGKGVSVTPLTVKYPQGAEKQLIDACLNRQVPSGGLPMDVGVLVQNVGTSSAIADAVIRGRPLIDRIVTISGSAVKTGGNFRARLGTPISVLIEAAGGVTGKLSKLIAGGPMMGFAQHTDAFSVTKGTSGVLLFDEADVERRPPEPCIRCGRCIRACPMNICPTEIATLGRLGLVEEARSADAMDCIECGSCAFGCPSRIPLVQEIRLAKAMIIQAQRKEKQGSNHGK